MVRWVVTGGAGFLGRHLLEALAHGASAEDSIVALDRDARPPAGRVRFQVLDLASPRALASALDELRPDVVFHLAGRLPPAGPDELHRGNVGLTARLLDALRALDRPLRLVLAGSAAELGPVPAALLPVDELTPCRPVEPYGLSKWAATRLALAAPGRGEVVVGRIFNPIGPGMNARQAFGRFARLLAGAAEHPLTLPVGHLDARRDFIDVRDVASALVALAREGVAGRLYHVASGTCRTARDGLHELLALSGREVRVVEPPPSAGGSLFHSATRIDRILRETSWTPRIAWRTSLADLWSEVAFATAGQDSPAGVLRVA
jgi:GDP-4-dehydro-6-deoxy-D-mannose reductase